MDIWEKRRKNLRAILGYENRNASQVAREAGLSVNTLGKFLKGETKSLRWDTLEKVCHVIGINNPAILDSDNPFSDTKNRIYKIINSMSDDDASKLLDSIDND